MILLDNTVLSNFALADEIHLLEEFCRGTGATTVKVVAEFDAGVTQGLFNPPDRNGTDNSGNWEQCIIELYPTRIFFSNR